MDEFEHEYCSDFKTLDNLQGGQEVEPSTSNDQVDEPAVKRAKAQSNVYTIPGVRLDLSIEVPDYSIPSRSLQDPLLPTLTHRELSIYGTIARVQRARDIAYKNSLKESNGINPQTQKPTKKIRVHRFPPNTDWIGVISGAGRRFYFSVKVIDSKLVADEVTKQIDTSGLFRDSSVRKEAQQILYQKGQCSSIPDDQKYDVCTEENDCKSSLSSLWVDKYKPYCYIDLLSEEGVNRTLLMWLKLWDECVFGRAHKPKTTAKKRPFDNNAGGSKASSFTNKKFGSQDLATELDQHKRPQHKIALLSGPPGLGKTTLAQVIARQVGYHTVEINASDDRTVDAFKKVIETATQMRMTLDDNPRPNCLIIDEIDGAPLPSITYMVNLYKGGAADKKQVIKRPIICICNDLYAPSLRELRRTALVLQFPATDVSNLVKRLHTICRLEHLQIRDERALKALCEKTDADIRSCINTLQFMKISGTCFDLAHAEQSNFGQKDDHKGLFAIWDEIFTASAVKQQLVNSLNFSSGQRFYRILNLIQHCDDEDKLRQGLFENYLNQVLPRESELSSIVRSSEWMLFAENITTFVNRFQAYGLKQYSAYLPVAYHLLLARPGYHKLAYPNSQHECFMKHTKHTGLLQSFMEDMDARAGLHIDSTSAVLDLLPRLCELIQPPIRSISSHLYSAKERVEIAGVVGRMVTYGLTYHQQKLEDGQYAYTLEPNVELIVRFPESRPRRGLSYSVKQMVAREVELEKVRKAQRNAPASATGVFPAVEGANLKDCPQKRDISACKPLHKATGGRIVEETVRVDFFGRKVPASYANVKENKQSSSFSAIYFRYREGSSNAVRRQLRMKDLL